MDNADALRAIDEGISLWWRTIGSVRGFVHRTGDIEWVKPAGGPGPGRIFHVRLAPEHAEERIDEIVVGMRNGALPGGMLLTPLSTPADTIERLAQRGLQIDDSSPCMALELAGFAAPPAASGITVSAVGDAGTLQLWAEVVNKGLFGCELFSPEQYEDMLRMESTRLYLGHLDGCAASACMTIHEAGTATLECVATLPEFRRRGLGAAVVSSAIIELKALGVGVVTLRSEIDAIELYRKLGFVEYCKRIVASVDL